MEDFKCKICDSKTSKIFSKKILNKYNISYFQCSNCEFIQTEKPYWLQESYSSAITSLDIGLVNRNIQYSSIVENILYENFNKNGRFLDFAGGYGMFTRIMRDKGFDFYHEDKHCENLFAKHFEIGDLKSDEKKFELVTAFELMEHIEDPYKELDYILSMTDNFLFSTELIPSEDIENWWYLGIEHGQHISFYTKNAISEIAKMYKKNYFSNGYLHLITNKKNQKIFEEKEESKKIFDKIFGKNNGKIKDLASKTQDDYEFVRNMIFYEK